MGDRRTDGFRIGINLKPGEISVGVVDGNYHVISKSCTVFELSQDCKTVAERVAECAGWAAESAGLSLKMCGFAGIGIPGICNSITGEVVYSGCLTWTHVPFGKELKKLLPMPSQFTNLDNCFLWAEVLSGSAARCSNLVLLRFESGVTGSVMLGGKIFEGKYCAGVQLGHCTLVWDGKPCKCGRRGCFEMYASLGALISQAEEAAKKSKKSALNLKAEEGITIPYLLECAGKGDKASGKVLDQYTDYVSDGIINAVNMFRPELVVIGGGDNALWKWIMDEVNLRCCSGYYGATVLPVPKIIRAAAGADAGIIGAAYIDGGY